MEAPAIVEALDPIDDVEPGERAGRIATPVNSLDLECLKKLSIAELSQQLARRLIDGVI